MRQHGNRSARRAAALVSFTVTACVLPPDRDLPLATGEVDGAATDRGGTGVGGGAVDMTPTADVVRGDAAAGGDARVVEPPTPDVAVVEPPTPDVAVVEPPTPDAAPPVVDAALPGPDAAVVLPPDPDAAVVLPPEPDGAVINPPESDAVVGPVIDAAGVLPPEPDAAVVVPSDAVVGPVIDAAVVVPPDAALPEPDAAPVCGTAGCLTVEAGEIDLRDRVARILGHLAACGPAIDPAAAVDIRLDDARYTLPAGSLQSVSGRLEGCVGVACPTPKALPVARAVFRPGFNIEPERLSINGVISRPTSAADDVVSTVSMGVSAIAYAAVINDMRCATGVAAVPLPTIRVGFEPVAGGRLSGLDTLVVNGVPMTNLDVSERDADGALVAAINAEFESTGVVASVDLAGRLELTAPDGRNIYVEATTESARIATGASPFPGLTTPRRGDVLLVSPSRFILSREAYRYHLVSSDIGPWEGHTTIIDGDEYPDQWLVDEWVGWRINGHETRRPIEADDLVSTSRRNLSAIARASAINETTAIHGVQATPLPVIVPLNPMVEIPPHGVSPSPLRVNGVDLPAIDFNLGDSDTMIREAIAASSNELGVHIEDISGVSCLVGNDGRNLEIVMDPVLDPGGSDGHHIGRVLLRAGEPFHLVRLISLDEPPSHASAGEFISGVDSDVRLTVDPETGGFELRIVDGPVQCLTPADGIDTVLDIGELGGTTFMLSEMTGRDRFAVAAEMCE
jgi:hypothetical protein